jgi:chloride channel 3/4/5
VRLGYADAGFPVLTKEPTVGGDGRSHSCFRIVGFIGINELEHALTELQDEPDAVVNLAPDEGLHSSRMSIFSFTESHEGRHNPYDLSQYIDRVSASRSRNEGD